MIENYRPISLICNFAKVFELVCIDFFFLTFVIRSPNLSMVSCMAVLLLPTYVPTFTQFVSDSFDKRLQVDVAYMDFSKAFDKLQISEIPW